MAAKISSIVRLQIPAGKANPAPPVGTVLGPRGVNIMEFCKGFNEATKNKTDITPVVITILADKTFSFIIKEPPVSVLIKKYANITSGSKEPGKIIVGKITKSKILEIAKQKIVDMTSSCIESAMKEISGSAYSMGIEVIED